MGRDFYPKATPKPPGNSVLPLNNRGVTPKFTTFSTNFLNFLPFLH